MNPLRAIAPRLLRRYLRLALVALLFNALAPALAQAWAAGETPSGRLVAMCTGMGLQQVLIQNSPEDVDSGKTPGMELGAKHCPFCLGADPLPPLPTVRAEPAPRAPELLLGSRADPPTPSLVARRGATAAPRGPPALA